MSTFSNASVIETHNLTFSYGAKRPVLKGISLHVPQGSIYGFLGPNGAGKTTTMRLLSGLIPCNTASISLFGKSLEEQLPQVFHRVGSLIETPSLYLHLSGTNNLKLVAKWRGLPETSIPDVLAWVDLAKDAHIKAGKYSLGMKQRLAIAMALLSNPDLLLLDEPVNGLDPSGMVEVRELLKKLNRELGTTIFISSHLLPEMEKMSTHIGIIHKGCLHFEGTLQQLSQKAASERVLTVGVGEAAHWAEALKDEFPGIRILGQDRLEVSVSDKTQAALLNTRLVQAGAAVHELKLYDGLEEWFMQMTKH